MSDSRYFGELAAHHPDRHRRTVLAAARTVARRTAPLQSPEARVAELRHEREQQKLAEKFHGWRMGRIKGFEQQLDTLADREKLDFDPRILEKENQTKAAHEAYTNWQWHLDDLMSEFAASLPRDTNIDIDRVTAILREKNARKGARTRSKKRAARNQFGFDF